MSQSLTLTKPVVHVDVSEFSLIVWCNVIDEPSYDPESANDLGRIEIRDRFGTYKLGVEVCDYGSSGIDVSWSTSVFTEDDRADQSERNLTCWPVTMQDQVTALCRQVAIDQGWIKKSRVTFGAVKIKKSGKGKRNSKKMR